MTNTIPNVPRKLLERASNLAFQTQHYPLHEELRTLLSAPSPAGVDGLEVVAYRVSLPDEPELGTWLDEDAENEPQMCLHEPLCRLSDAQAIIDGLRAEVGAQRVKTCAALKERNDAREERDSFQRIGIRQIEHRYQLAALLREKFPRIDPHHPITLSEVDHCCEYVLHKDRERLHCAIDAALSAVCAAAPNIATTSEHSGS